MSGFERHAANMGCDSSTKLSRPQKRRKRADRAAIRNALVFTADLKEQTGIIVGQPSSVAGGGSLHIDI
eukprot:6636018-Karenia_brevis.AAC.1